MAGSLTRGVIAASNSWRGISRAPSEARCRVRCWQSIKATPCAPQEATSAAAAIAPASDAAFAVSVSDSSPAVEAPGPVSPAGRRPEPTSPPRPRLHGGRSRRPVRSMALAASLVAAFLGLTASSAGPPTHNGSPKPNRASAGTAPPLAPLTWTADSHTVGLSGCGEDYVVDKPPREVPPPPHPEDIAAWAASQRAVHGGSTGVRITVQGRGSAAVVLEALYVRVVNRAAPAARRGIAYSTADGCGATVQPRYFSVNLDVPRPRARAVPAGRPASVAGRRRR